MIAQLCMLICLSNPVTDSVKMDVLRQEFHQAVLEEEKIRDFHAYINDVDQVNPVIVAYRAASEAMMAKVVWSPIDKYQQIVRFEKLMDEAVKKDSQNIEVRFLRLSVQYYIPRFLGFSKDLTTDRDFIITNIEKLKGLKIDSSYARYIVYFLKQTGFYEAKKLALIEDKLSER